MPGDLHQLPESHPCAPRAQVDRRFAIDSRKELLHRSEFALEYILGETAQIEAERGQKSAAFPEQRSAVTTPRTQDIRLAREVSPLGAEVVSAPARA